MSAGNLKPSVAISAEANFFSDPGLTSMVTVKWLRSFWISCREVDNRQTAFIETAQLTRSISFLLIGRKYISMCLKGLDSRKEKELCIAKMELCKHHLHFIE